jgi:hypothetical protein
VSGNLIVCDFDPRREALRVKEWEGYLLENVGLYDEINAAIVDSYDRVCYGLTPWTGNKGPLGFFL